MAKSKKQPASEFEKAVDFLALTFDPKQDQSKYCKIQFNQAVAFNMIVGIGTPIQVDLECCPNTDLLREAVKRCKDQFSLSQYSIDKLIVKQDDFHAFIPCLRSADILQWTEPDPPIAQLGNEFIEALDTVSPFADDKNERLMYAAIHLFSSSVMATYGSAVIQAWHGFDMPNGLLIPKASAKLLHRAKKQLVSFGYSKQSITFHFSDGCWLQSRLYGDHLADIRPHLDGASIANMHDIPANFFAAVEQVLPFSQAGYIWVEGNRVSSHPFNVVAEGSGLTLSFDGPGHAFRRYSGEDLHRIRKIAKRWDEFGRDDGTIFFGEKLRGMIWHSNEVAAAFGTVDDDAIPF